MYQAVIVVHILLGLSIIGLILIQQGKGADAGAGFGGGASGSVFGAQGAASFLSRTTAILATCFFITSLGLAWMNSNRPGSTDFMSSSSAEEKVVNDLTLPNIKEVKPEAAQPTHAPAATTDKPVNAPPATPAAPAPVETPAPAAEHKAEPNAKDKEVVKEKEPEPKPHAPKHESAKGKKK
jgi:preprotein translocase subunit SecG